MHRGRGVCEAVLLAAGEGAHSITSTNGSGTLVVAGAASRVPFLGADAPAMARQVVMRCRQMGKPVIVASHLLQSMIEYPTPTRAEVLP